MSTCDNPIFDDEYRLAREGVIPVSLSNNKRYGIAVDALSHCIEELIELRKLIPRKSWKDEHDLAPIGNQETSAEMADVLLFLDVVRWYLGFTQEDMEHAVKAKRRVNDEVRTDHHKRKLEIEALGEARY